MLWTYFKRRLPFEPLLQPRATAAAEVCAAEQLGPRLRGFPLVVFAPWMGVASSLDGLWSNDMVRDPFWIRLYWYIPLYSLYTLIYPNIIIVIYDHIGKCFLSTRNWSYNVCHKWLHFYLDTQIWGYEEIIMKLEYLSSFHWCVFFPSIWGSSRGS